MKQVSPLKKLIVKIDHFDCSSCSMDLEGILEDADGIEKAVASYAKETMIITYDFKKITKEKIIERIKQDGYAKVTIVEE